LLIDFITEFDFFFVLGSSIAHKPTLFEKRT